MRFFCCVSLSLPQFHMLHTTHYTALHCSPPPRLLPRFHARRFLLLRPAPPRARSPPQQQICRDSTKHQRWDEAKQPVQRGHRAIRAASTQRGARTKLTTLSSAFSSRVRSATPRSDRPKRFEGHIWSAPRRPHWPAHLKSHPPQLCTVLSQDTTIFPAACLLALAPRPCCPHHDCR
jgi:hypothetical protein